MTSTSYRWVSTSTVDLASPSTAIYNIDDDSTSSPSVKAFVANFEQHEHQYKSLQHRPKPQPAAKSPAARVRAAHLRCASEDWTKSVVRTDVSGNLVESKPVGKSVAELRAALQKSTVDSADSPTSKSFRNSNEGSQFKPISQLKDALRQSLENLDSSPPDVVLRLPSGATTHKFGRTSLSGENCRPPSDGDRMSTTQRSAPRVPPKPKCRRRDESFDVIRGRSQSLGDELDVTDGCPPSLTTQHSVDITVTLIHDDVGYFSLPQRHSGRGRGGRVEDADVSHDCHQTSDLHDSITTLTTCVDDVTTLHVDEMSANSQHVDVTTTSDVGSRGSSPVDSLRMSAVCDVFGPSADDDRDAAAGNESFCSSVGTDYQHSLTDDTVELLRAVHDSRWLSTSSCTDSPCVTPAEVTVCDGDYPPPTPPPVDVSELSRKMMSTYGQCDTDVCRLMVLASCYRTALDYVLELFAQCADVTRYRSDLLTFLDGANSGVCILSLEGLKESLTESIRAKHDVLIAARQSVDGQVEVIRHTQSEMNALIRSRVDSRHFDKYERCMTDFDQVTRLLVMLASRLARFDNASLAAATSADAKLTPTNQRSSLVEKLNDARMLKTDIERRSESVSRHLRTCLTDTEFDDYLQLMASRCRVVLHSQEVTDWLAISKSQLDSLQSSSSPCSRV